MSRFHVDRQHKHGRISLFLIGVILVFLLLAAGTFSVAYWYQANLNPVAQESSEIVVNIEEGQTASEIAKQLESSGVIKSATAFDLYVRLNNYRNSLQAGGYKLDPSQNVQQIVSKLVNGEIASDLVIILPARRIDQVKADLVKAGFTRDEVNQGIKPDNYVSHPVYRYIPEGATLEGYIYPDSYQKNTQTTVQDIVVAALNELDEVLTDELIQQFAKQGLTVHQAIILASIVEREVPAASEDRPTVAQVYLKRLAEDMPLQADPTAQYGALFATGTEDSWLTYDSPYNTYIYKGLPIGPISNVSKSSLEAVANPSDTDFLFFVADDNDDNTTHFSRTLAEHEANIEKYCQVKCGSY